eukprot:6471241-Prymnesium_polylepis.1
MIREQRCCTAQWYLGELTARVAIGSERHLFTHTTEMKLHERMIPSASLGCTKRDVMYRGHCNVKRRDGSSEVG